MQAVRKDPNPPRVLGQILAQCQGPVPWHHYVRTCELGFSSKPAEKSALRTHSIHPTHLPLSDVTPSPLQPMSTRSYNEAVDILNSLQSTEAMFEALRASGRSASDFVIPEMLDYLHRIGYSVST